MEKYVTLTDGVKMPVLGLGVYQVEDHEQCENTVILHLMQVIS